MHCYLQLLQLRHHEHHVITGPEMADRICYSSSSRFPGLIIANVVFTANKLGIGADATVYEVEWNGTLCAAKRLHEILLEDQSSGGVAKLLSNFEAECLTWSKLRHPGVVQFLGVHLDLSSRLPVLVMEKMDTSLRTYLEDHSKEEFPLHKKAFVLRQVSQALAYLHCQAPPLVHHDLSTNNVLLNEVSFVAKVSDFGMSRAIHPSALGRKSSVKGTLAFMAPEALQIPPHYNEKLDVFSFGSVILHTLTHEWPNPGASTRYDGDMFVGITELQRRERYVEMLIDQEKQLFLPIVHPCLENRPDKRPSGVMLVRELRHIESSLPTGVTIEELCQQLSAKEEECRQKDKVIREMDGALAMKDDVIKEKDGVIWEKDEALREKDEALKENDKALREGGDALREKDEALREREDALREMEEVLGEKDKVLMENGEALKEKDDALKEMEEALREREQALRAKDDALRENDKVLREREQVLKKKDDALKEDIIIRKGKVDNQQLRSESNRAIEIRQQLATKEEKCRRKDVIVREKSATIQAQQVEIQWLKDQPAVPQKVS